MRILSLYDQVDVFTNTPKIVKNLVIWDSDNLQTILFQKFCTPLIFSLVIFLVMLRTVQFYDQLRLRTVKVRDIFSQHLLSGEFYGI